MTLLTHPLGKWARLGHDSRNQLGSGEALRCQSKQRTATTFHAVIGVPGEPDYAWVACSDCTGLMIEGAYGS